MDPQCASMTTAQASEFSLGGSLGFNLLIAVYQYRVPTIVIGSKQCNRIHLLQMGSKQATACPAKVCAMSQQAVFMTHDKYLLKI